jgi:hypothetical protein
MAIHPHPSASREVFFTLLLYFASPAIHKLLEGVRKKANNRRSVKKACPFLSHSVQFIHANQGGLYCGGHGEAAF